MKNRIYNYIRNKNGVDIHSIAECLNINEITVLRCLNELQRDGFITISSVIPLDSTVESGSVLYKSTNKKYR